MMTQTEGAKCRCQRGYSGDRCESAVCLPECMNGGECVSPEVCSCKNGYTGARCQRGESLRLTVASLLKRARPLSVVAIGRGQCGRRRWAGV